MGKAPLYFVKESNNTKMLVFLLSVAVSEPTMFVLPKLASLQTLPVFVQKGLLCLAAW